MIAFLFIHTGCINDVSNLKEVTLTGTVQLADDTESPQGILHLTALREWRGEGELRYPMLPIDSVELDGLGIFEWTFTYEVDRDEGLALYGWLDRDEDGVFCSLNGEVEPAGLTVIEDDSGYVLPVDLLLDSDCIGVERLYSLQNTPEDEAQ